MVERRQMRTTVTPRVGKVFVDCAETREAGDCKCCLFEVGEERGGKYNCVTALNPFPH